MGRKNRNARGRGYTSFAELKSATLKFDLSKGNFVKKTKRGCGGRGSSISDISVSIGNNGKGDSRYVSFSVKDEIANKIVGESGNHWTCGLVQSDNFERCYIIPDEMGFALYKSKEGTRWYLRVRVDELAPYEKYAGHHRIQYDEYNKAYYFTAME